MSKLIRTKTFWAGLSLALLAWNPVLAGSVAWYDAVVWTQTLQGLAFIFVRHSILKESLIP